MTNWDVIWFAALEAAIRRNPALGLRNSEYARWSARVIGSIRLHEIDEFVQAALLWIGGRTSAAPQEWLRFCDRGGAWKGSARAQARDRGGWPWSLARAVADGALRAADRFEAQGLADWPDPRIAVAAAIGATALDRMRLLEALAAAGGGEGGPYVAAPEPLVPDAD